MSPRIRKIQILTITAISIRKIMCIREINNQDIDHLNTCITFSQCDWRYAGKEIAFVILTWQHFSQAVCWTNKLNEQHAIWYLEMKAKTHPVEAMLVYLRNWTCTQKASLILQMFELHNGMILEQLWKLFSCNSDVSV